MSMKKCVPDALQDTGEAVEGDRRNIREGKRIKTGGSVLIGLLKALFAMPSCIRDISDEEGRWFPCAATIRSSTQKRC